MSEVERPPQTHKPSFDAGYAAACRDARETRYAELERVEAERDALAARVPERPKTGIPNERDIAAARELAQELPERPAEEITDAMVQAAARVLTNAPAGSTVHGLIAAKARAVLEAAFAACPPVPREEGYAEHVDRDSPDHKSCITGHNSGAVAPPVPLPAEDEEPST